MFDNQDEKNRIIMFSTQEAMDFLASCKTLFMDGTVETGPVLFDQVYTIHGKFFSWSLDELNLLVQFTIANYEIDFKKVL